jgi:hypothetical protein
MLITTFLTEIWVLLFTIAYGLLTVIVKFRPMLDFLRWLLPLREQPIRALGMAAGVFLILLLTVVEGIKRIV